MTLRELLNEEHVVDRNYWAATNKDKSVVSGKTILGFPGTHEHIPVSDDGVMFDSVNIGDNTYEFYVGDYKDTHSQPYRYKDCYIGTAKVTDFDDSTGIALSLINRFINSPKLNNKQVRHLKDYYNKNIKQKYLKGYFKEI